jgi:PAS domain S-box-containing protein
MLKKKPTHEELEQTQYEELKASKAFIETVLNSLTDSLYVIRTADFTVLGANKAFTDALGLDANSIIGKHCYELTHHRSAPCVHSHHPCPLMETLKTGKPSIMEHIHFDSADGERVVEVSAFPIRDERGEIQQIVHVDRDITERKKMLETLKKSEERLRLIYEKSLIALGFIDQDGIVTDCNDALSKIIGSPRKMLIGFNMKENIKEPGLKAAIMLAFSGSMGAFEGKYKTITSGKALYLRAFFVPVVDENNAVKGVQFLAEDITDRKQFEEQLLNHNEALEKLVGERTAELAMRNKNLEEMNTALHVLLQKREEDRRQVEEIIVTNVKSLVYPYVELMKKGPPDAKQDLLLDIIETRINELLSPLLKKLEQFNLTPKEVQVAAMVKDGKITKDIAEILGVETSSIDAHRYSIRKKLGLNRNVNLQLKLQSLM